MRSVRGTFACTAVAVLVLAGCDAGDPDGEGANVVEPTEDTDGSSEEGTDGSSEEGTDGSAAEEPAATEEEAGEAETEPAPEPVDDEAIVGTRENPVPPGTTFVVGDWEVTVGETVQDATDLLKAENEFNEIAEGRQPVMVEVTATYIGEDSGDAFDLTWAYLGSEGNTFGGSDMDDFCGVIPDAFDEAGEAFPDATIDGNVCFQVPAEQVDGGAWIVEDTFSFDGGDRTFVSAG